MPPRVVIIGAGFAGLTAAKALRHAPVDVTVIDRHNHHTFQPLLYQVATAGLATTDIASPIRGVLAGQRNVTVLMAEAIAIDAARKAVLLSTGEVSYDYLILAAGATHSYFGHDDWAPHAPGLKSLEDALEIRRRILLAYESAENPHLSPAERDALLTFVVIGGGPTGVELAGALAEIARKTMTRNFRNFDPGDSRIILIEAASRLLLAFPEDLGARAHRDLEELGVQVRLSTPAKSITAGGVQLENEFIPSKTVLWGAGVRGEPLARTLGVELDRAGRVPVLPDLTLAGHPAIFVLGDIAAFTQDGKPLPGVATVAIQQGRHAAQNIARAASGQPLVTFRYEDPGSMATIGRNRAVAWIRGWKFGGFFAWLVWLFVHIMSLVEFRNRVFVFFDWAWMYITFQRAARIIVTPQAPATSAASPAAMAQKK